MAIKSETTYTCDRCGAQRIKGNDQNRTQDPIAFYTVDATLTWESPGSQAHEKKENLLLCDRCLEGTNGGNGK
jgi:hypothetical protein